VRCVDQFALIFLFLRIFFQSVALRSAVIDEHRQDSRQTLEFGAISGGIAGLPSSPSGIRTMPVPEGNDARDFYLRGAGSAGTLAGLDAFDALVDVRAASPFF